MSYRTAIAALVAAPLVFGPTGIASAQEPLPRSGEFSLSFYFVNPTPFPVIPGAEGVVTVNNNWIAWLHNNSGSGFGHLMTGQCVAFTSQAGPTMVESYVNCVYTDPDGDQLFEELRLFPDGAVGNYGWIRGTGKYAGITSEMTLELGAPRTEAGYRMIYGVKTGTYTLP